MKQDTEKKISRVLEALENPSAFTSDELKELFKDEECLKAARAILYGREALARSKGSLPDADKEWDTFRKRRKKHSTTIYMLRLSSVAACILFFLYFALKPVDSDDSIQVFEANSVTQVVKQEIIDGQQIISVPRGLQKRIILPDGTSVILNADSRLSYDMHLFGEKNRTVNLSGEGFFVVSKDSLHPFIVQSGKINTCVLGTSFNIRNYRSESPNVTLFSGSLQVASVTDKENLLIKPGEQVELNKEDELCVKENVHIADAKSWTEKTFFFDNKTLKEILCELGRWYNVNVIFKDKDRMNDRLHFKASRDESLNSVIELLGFISDDISIIDNKTIIVGK